MPCEVQERIVEPKLNRIWCDRDTLDFYPYLSWRTWKTIQPFLVTHFKLKFLTYSTVLCCDQRTCSHEQPFRCSDKVVCFLFQNSSLWGAIGWVVKSMRRCKGLSHIRSRPANPAGLWCQAEPMFDSPPPPRWYLELQRVFTTGPITWVPIQLSAIHQS